MTILLTILKGIGILLLVILGILLAVSLLVLFVPVRYRAEGTYQEEFKASGHVTWLLHLLSVRFSYDTAFSYSVRIAGLCFLPRRQKRRKRSDTSLGTAPPDGREADGSGDGNAAKQQPDGQARKTARTAQPDGRECKAARTAQPDEQAHGTAADRARQSRETAKPAAHKAQQEEKAAIADDISCQEEKTPAAEGAKDPAGFWDKLLRKIYAIFRKYREKYETICAKIKQIREKLSDYVRILTRQETKELLSLTIRQLRRVIAHVLPRRLEVCMNIGTGDPASTGQLLALQGMLYPVLKGKILILPDFENKRLEGSFFMRGRITGFVLLLCVLRVAINKNFRQLIRILRKKEEA